MELKNIKGIGEKTIESLNDANIFSVSDLLYSFPKNYLIFEEEPSLLFNGCDTLIKGILTSKPYFIKYRVNTYAITFFINAYNNRVKCIIFSNDYLKYRLHQNTNVLLYGHYNFQQQEFFVSKIFFDEFEIKVETEYKIKNVKDNLIKKSVISLFQNGLEFSETLPKDLITKYKLYDKTKYMYLSHNPSNKEEVRQVLRRRKYEEFFWYMIKINLLKEKRKVLKPKRNFNESIIQDFLNNISFNLTKDQEKAVKEITKDIISDYPMNRLVEGDVGSGKSIVGVIASFLEIKSGFQVCLMTPSLLLAKQQYDNIKNIFKKWNINVSLLVSSIKNRGEVIENLRSGKTSIVIGTQALLNEEITFNNLGLVIIDEQHKFGVNQRKKLLDKFQNVDALYLTATPIPRTLGLTTFGDLNISEIHSMPEGRIKVKTKIVDYKNLKPMMEFVASEIKLGHKIYAVVPHVLENDEYKAKTLVQAKSIFEVSIPSAKIGVIHGKVKNIDKDKQMQDFLNGNINVLISTTVVEVGLNVLDATVMIVFDANLFGLSTLHQLRGRVGRSNLKSYCFLVTNDTTNERLKVLEEKSSGFDVSEYDFKLRGPGDYLGQVQSGYFNLKYASFDNDMNILNCAKNDAEEYLPKFLKKEIKSSVFNDIIKISLDKINQNN